MKGKFLFNLLLVCCLCNFSKTISAQDDYAKNSSYLELMGKGFYYSLNYERNLFNFSEKLGMNASIGFSLTPGYTDIESSMDFTMPLQLNVRYIISGNHQAVLGGGSTFWSYKLTEIPINNANVNQQPLEPTLKKVTEWFGHLNLEYRYCKPTGGLLLKAGITPLYFARMQNFAYQEKSNMAMSYNIGVGYSF